MRTHALTLSHDSQTRKIVERFMQCKKKALIARFNAEIDGWMLRVVRTTWFGCIRTKRCVETKGEGEGMGSRSPASLPVHLLR